MSVYVRILLRYLLGYLVLKGIVPQDIADMIESDPEIAAAVGGVLVLAVEGVTVLARRLGWKT